MRKHMEVVHKIKPDFDCENLGQSPNSIHEE